MISVRNLEYKNILNSITIELKKEVHFLSGPNGAGKTTFLDCLSGLNNTFKGEVEGNSDMVYLNQNMYFSHRLKVKDFIQFVYTKSGITDYKNAFFQYAESHHLQDKMTKLWNQKIGVLSGGEVKLLYFLAFSSLRHEWYIFDEPFSGVDRKTKKVMTDILRDMADRGKGIIITSHETEPLHEIGEYVELEISEGEMERVG